MGFFTDSRDSFIQKTMDKKVKKNLLWLSKAIVMRNISKRGGKKTKIAILKYEKKLAFINSVRQVHIVGLFHFIS